MNFRFIS